MVKPTVGENSGENGHLKPAFCGCFCSPSDKMANKKGADSYESTPLAEQQGFEPWHPFRGLRDFESFLPCSTQWKIEAPTPLYWKAQTIGITSKIHSAPKKHRSHADLNPLQKKRKNPPFGENLKRFCTCWRERARELPISSVHPQSMLLLLLTKAKQQRMDEHDNPVRVL